jgi:hypothetical protein
MRKFINLVTTTALIVGQVAAPALAQMPKPGGANRPAPAGKPAPGGYQKPAGGYQKPAGSSYQKPAGGYQKPAGGSYQKPATSQGNMNKDYKGTANNKKTNYTGANGGNNTVTINNNNNVNVSGNNKAGYYRPPANRPPGYYPPGARPPGYRPPGYYPPAGGYYRPFPPPVGGWGGYYYPPSRYYYDNDIGFGEVFAGVLVAGSLVALLSAATAPKPATVYVQGQPAPPPGPPPMYQPPPQSSGGPAAIRVDLAGLAPEARPSASTCLTEAARQIGATGGTEIRIKQIVDVEQGNGGYRFRLVLTGIYPDEARSIPMYCRATPEKIVELTFG